VRIALLLGLVATFPAATSASAPPFVGDISRVRAADLPYSYRAGCPVGTAQLRRVTVSHWDFGGRQRIGSVVVRSTVARDVLIVFRRLHAARFPIRRLRPIDAYKARDATSLAADNTAGFNCRYAIAPGAKRWSSHAYGLAIDVNPVENPYLDRGLVRPPAGRRYLDRSRPRPGMAIPGGVLVRAFSAIGWSWGGTWSAPDYQHFSATGG
jgi:D-alanyl-D-alanine carboxypeptidase